MRFRIFGYQIPSVDVGKLDISVYFLISFKFQRMKHGFSNRNELEFFIETWYLHTLSKFTWYLYMLLVCLVFFFKFEIKISVE